MNLVMGELELLPGDCHTRHEVGHIARCTHTLTVRDDVVSRRSTCQHVLKGRSKPENPKETVRNVLDRVKLHTDGNLS